MFILKLKWNLKYRCMMDKLTLTCWIASEVIRSLFWPLSNARSAIDWTFYHLKMTKHAMLWWDNYLDAFRIGRNPILKKWEYFKLLMKSQIFPINYEEEKLMKWKYIWQERGQGDQEYSFELWKKPIRMGIYLEELGVVLYYHGGLFLYILRQL